MRIVVLSLTDPWAHAHGGTLRTRALVAAAADLGHEVVVVHPGGTAPTPGSAARPPQADERVRVVAVATSTVGARAWPAWVSRVKRALLPMPTSIGGRSPALAAAVRGQGPADVLLVSVLPFAQHLRELPGAALWVDHSDLYSDVLAREARRRRGLARVTAGTQLRAVRRQEDVLAVRAGATTAAGSTDADELRRRSGAPVTWLPTPVPTAVVPRLPARRPAAGFFCNLGYWPNRDAWELLRTTWAPRLSALGWDVVLAGLGTDELVGTPGVEVLGPVPSPADFYARVDVALAPVRVGGGMKVKVVEALSHGRPVVATPFAVAGFPPALASAALVVEEDGEGLETLAAGPPSLPDDLQTRLEPFSHRAFRQVVAEVLDGVGDPLRRGAPTAARGQA